MKKLMKTISILIVLVVFSCNLYSQSPDTLSTYSPLNDSLKNNLQNLLALEAYRQYFRKYIPKAMGWVSDFDNLFTNNNLYILDSTIIQFNKETRIQIAIVTLDTFCVSKNDFEYITFHIANTWGVGKKDLGNGILISISKGYRHMRINNGYGIEKLISNKETKKIIDKYFIPSFKKGDYYKGTLKGLSELIKLIKQKQKN